MASITLNPATATVGKPAGTAHFTINTSQVNTNTLRATAVDRVEGVIAQ